jgi:oxygen-independent coproporphyrinogen-3 oxidase
LALQPQHLSTYGLTWERGTSFWSRRQHGTLQQVDEETERAMYAEAINTLVAAGFEHYEVSNFARSGHHCLHNQRYWDGCEYFAVGPGAARYVNGRREVNHRSTTTYIQRVLSGQSPVAEWEELSSDDRAREAFVFGMRRLAGVDRDLFENRFGASIDLLFEKELRKYIELGLIVDAANNLRLSPEGLFVSDAIWPDFLRR